MFIYLAMLFFYEVGQIVELSFGYSDEQIAWSIFDIIFFNQKLNL